MDSQSELDLNALMTALGPALEAAEIRFYEPNLWVVAFDETLAVEIEHDETGPKLVLSADLGLPPGGEEMSTNQLLLRTNALWRETGGLRMGIEDVGGRIKQTFHLYLQGLDAEGLKQRVHNFAQAARAWRTMIATPPTPESGANTPEQSSGFTSFGFPRI
jgi:hypothetical protein